MNPGHFENGQLENTYLENEEYSTWPSPEGRLITCRVPNSFL